MAQTSGFFEAVYDSTIVDPETGEYGYYDLRYYAYQFAQYFANFVGNGVFASPVDQLKVEVGEGFNVVVKSGWAYINGYWYHNDEDLVLPVAINRTSSPRVDSVRVRLSEANRSITCAVFTGDIVPTRTDMYYDLILAQVIVPASSGVITQSGITDMRGDTSVCGFVTGLLEVVDTQDLFDQYTEIFNNWFDDIKDQITDDMAVRLQQEINQLQSGKEDAFTKNTAFNKNFGNTSGTVCEGNDSRLSDARPASDVSEWAKANTKPSYDISEITNAKKITYSQTIPQSIPENGIVFVYE